MSKREVHEERIEDALDAAAGDKDLSTTEYIELMEDIASRCNSAAAAARDDIAKGRVPG